MNVRRFRVGDHAPVPWANNGGMTREIASGKVVQSALDAWDWRLSLASIDKNGPFSALPGVNRTSVLVDGALDLISGSLTLMWDVPGASHQYDGETPFEACLRSPSARFFNVMVRKGQADSDLHVYHDDAVLAPANVGTRCLLVLTGRFRVKLPGSTIMLEAEEGLLWSHATAVLHVALDTPEGCLVDVSLRPSTQNPT